MLLITLPQIKKMRGDIMSPTLNTLLTVIAFIVSILAFAYAVANASKNRKCLQVAIDPNTDPNCPAGGSYCGSSEGWQCSGTWPLTHKNCKTKYLTGGTCRCSCE